MPKLDLTLDILIPKALPLSGRNGAERLQRLERRKEFLKDRIENSGMDLSRDKAEGSALKWAIETIVDLEFRMEEIRTIVK